MKMITANNIIRPILSRRIAKSLARRTVSTLHGAPWAAATTRQQQQQQQQRQEQLSSLPQYCRSFSALTADEAFVDANGPFGELFDCKKKLGVELIGQRGCIHRTFGPGDNDQAMLATGGEALAANASFDPDYNRAQGWIRQHAVGPAVLSPVLLQGLTGALCEAAFPEGLFVSSSMKQLKPLIVGVAVKAKIQVEQVEHTSRCMTEHSVEKKNGYTVLLKTQVMRLRDEAIIVEGTQELWVPDYGRM